MSRYQIDSIELTVGYIISDVVDQIKDSLPVRREAVEAKSDYAPPSDYPITPAELWAFIHEFCTDDPFIGDALVKKRNSHVVIIPAAQYDRFLRNVSEASLSDDWLGADGPFYRPEQKRQPVSEARETKDIVSSDPVEPQVDEKTRIFSPSLNVLFSLFRRKINLDALNWRQLEEMIAELLKVEGYKVELCKGTKDDGADVIAWKELPTIGFVKTVWQSKHLSDGNKVGIGVIRELADVRNEHDATKGFIVTSSYLTRGALTRIQRDSYNLGKFERPELEAWMNRTLTGSVNEY